MPAFDDPEVDEIMIIGGGEIYATALPLTDRVYLTWVHASPKGDTTFPSLDPRYWRLSSKEPIERGPRDDHAATLAIYDRQTPAV